MTISIAPLRDYEKGRGAHISAARKEEIERECLRLIRLGYKQRDIGKMIGASRTRTSRWCHGAVKKAGDKRDRAKLNYRNATLLQLLWSRVEASDGCWNWRGVIKANGYGSFNYNETPVYPHRIMYETFVGYIPPGMVVDHICNNRCCCNPDHLQAVTQNENVYFSRIRDE